MDKKVQDLLDEDNLLSVLKEAQFTANVGTNAYFQKSRKRPFTRQQSIDLVSQSILMGQIKCCERMLMFLKHTDLFDTNEGRHFSDMMYGELCMYILRLNKLLYRNYKVKYDINQSHIHEETEEYIQRYKLRQKN